MKYITEWGDKLNVIWIKWLIILIVVVVLTTASIHLLLKKRFDYNKVCRYISLLGTIVGMDSLVYLTYIKPSSFSALVRSQLIGVRSITLP